MMNEALIVAAVRTPIGSLGGALSTVPATELGATCIKAVLDRARIPGDEVDEVIMGNVVSAGIGQNPARQAADTSACQPQAAGPPRRRPPIRPMRAICFRFLLTARPP